MYAVEFSHRSGRDLINVAKKRTNIIPIIEDARHPHKYRMLMGRCGLFLRYQWLWLPNISVVSLVTVFINNGCSPRWATDSKWL